MKPCKMFTSLSPYLIIVKGDEIFPACYHHSVETVTISKYVAEYEQMWKWMVEYVRKFQGHGIKIDWVNSLRVAK